MVSLMKSESNNSCFGILIHGGSDTKRIDHSTEKKDNIRRFLRSSVSHGFAALKKGNSAVDSVEVSVASMEDSGVFNAGTGACLTINKRIEMDASIMNGRDISAGCVGMVKGISNPIKLARQVMERTDHVMIVSDGVNKLAKLSNMHIGRSSPNQQSLNKFYDIKRNMKKRWKKNNDLLFMALDHNNRHLGTVGAVAIDKEGNVASGVSTGGRWLKMSGRIGDSAVIGGGLYADNKSGAACATGNGEYIMRLCMCKYACDQMQSNNALISSKRSIALLTERFGKNTGGIITVDRRGRFGVAYNTLDMPIASITSKDEKVKFAFQSNRK
jgi:L-asparaginase / beta-aspartyl-peptidase